MYGDEKPFDDFQEKMRLEIERLNLEIAKSKDRHDELDWRLTQLNEAIEKRYRP